MSKFSVKLVAALSVMVMACQISCLSYASGIHHYDVGVLALRGHEHAKATWQPTLDWLENRIPGISLELHTYNFDDLEDAFKHNQLDFLLTSPGQATKIARQYPMTWLATQKTPYSQNPTKSIASVVVVEKDSPYRRFEDLEQAEIAAVSEKAFGGFLAFRYELDKLGYFSSSFFENIRFTGPPTDQLILDVAAGKLDVAIVPACTLEHMARDGKVDIQKLRVVNGKRPANSVCEVSTPLYPNWTLAKTNRAPSAIGKQITQALLAMPADAKAAQAAGNIGWTTAVSTVEVDKVYRHLDLHPLQKSWHETAADWWKRNRALAAGIIFVIVLLNVYHFWLEYRFKRSREELESTLYDLKEKNAMLEHAQRTMIVGELGSSLAHEINQPLAAIKNYSVGARMRIEQGVDPKEMLPILDKIRQQVTVASGTVQRLRNLIRKEAPEKSDVWLDKLAQESFEVVEYDFSHHGLELFLQVAGDPEPVRADYVGLQQLILNLLTNAKEACLACEPPTGKRVELVVMFAGNEVIIEVQDNGIGVDEHTAHLIEAFYTTKADGLGLGLAICREVVESHSGHLTLTPGESGGCVAQVRLPIKRENKDAGR